MIVMDHQPFNLEESEDIGAALQVSGHTHRGQIFPINFIVSGIYEKHYGYYRRGSTNYFISSGAGTWGPPVRTTGRPEIVILTLDMM
jgi:predicted MPP superfamily phosphohydrolase